MTMSDTKKSTNDYIFGKLIGEGSFSSVYYGRDVNTRKDCAIKVCEKRHIRKEKKTNAIMRERQIMKILTDHPSPFIIELHCTFQDNDRLYFVMSYAKYGELLPFINKVGSFDEQCTGFYSAEILMALEHLHKLGIVHRDLKPENILLNEKMHIQITDFGSGLILNHNNGEQSSSLSLSSSNHEIHAQRRRSFVGTAHYVSPEMLTEKNSFASSDLWALGCIIYQMISALPPFRGATEYLIFQKILTLDYEFPDGFNDAAKTLVQSLLQLNPKDRIGANDDLNSQSGYKSIKDHLFFIPLKDKWSILHEQTPPRLVPYLPGTSENEELRSDLDNLEPGLEDKQLTRLLGLELCDNDHQSQNVNIKRGILDISPEDLKQKLTIQREHNPFHRYVDEHLILKQGFVDKRKGLFARKRMLLLTTGPHLYYVDVPNQIRKGEIPWSADLRPEPKNFKTFFVHTPKRTYFLEDHEGNAPEWCRIIEEVRLAAYPQHTHNTNTPSSSASNSNKNNKDSSRKFSTDKKS